MNAALAPNLSGLKAASICLGIGGGIGCVAARVWAPAEFFQWYLVAFYFWTSLSLGCLFWLLLHHLVSGKWGFAVQRVMEAGALTLPVMAIMFLPVALGMDQLYIWTDAGAVQGDTALQHKQSYLNVPFFLARTGGYFLVWSVFALLLRRWSILFDRDKDPRHYSRMSVLSGPGMAVFVLAATFAAFDWLMSLEPHWYSSVYGAETLAGNISAALALGIIVLEACSRRGACRPDQQDFYDLGNLLLMSVMLWAYLAFSQYLIIWSANIPEETTWYLRRSSPTWRMLVAVLFALHFAFPFMFLLVRFVKQNSKLLSALAGVVLVAHLLDACWLVCPSLLHWSAPAAMACVGGVWLFFFLHALGRQPIEVAVPQPSGAPQLEAPHAPA